MTARRFGERFLTVGIAAGLAVLMIGAIRRVPDPIAGGSGGGAKGRSGALDTSFAGDGTLMTFIPPVLAPPDYNTDIPYAVAIDGDGGVLVAGFGTTHQFALERFSADGTLDTAFGTDGLATFPSQAYGQATCMVVQPDGRILVAGGLDAYSALARFMPDGSLDPGFGQGGVVLQAQPRGGATNIALLPDGRIVLGGGGVGYTLSLARYESNGLPDNTFGTNGVVDTGLLASGRIDMARQADGRFVFVYFAGIAAGTQMIRLDSDGSPDAGFGTGGVVSLPVFGQAVVVRPDGMILVGGASYNVVDGFPPSIELLDFQVAGFNPDGSRDASFGGEGLGLVTPSLHGRSAIQALALDAQGRLVAAGSVSRNSGASDFALARYAPDGRLDLSFGKSGTTTADVDGLHLDEPTARAMAVQPDGRLVVVGEVTIDQPGPLDSFAWGLARFLP